MTPPRETPHSASSPDWRNLFANLARTARDPRLVRFYEAGAASRDTPISELPMVALDLETTGLDPTRHAIVSYGLVPFSLGRIRCREAAYRVVKPVSELEGASVAFHQITHSDIRNAPGLESVIEELLLALAGKVVVVHYRTIERQFLDHALRYHLGEGLRFPVIDTMELEAKLHPRDEPAWLTWVRRRPPASIRLADSRLRYGLPHYGSHQALTDAMATAELLQAQIAHHYSPEVPVADLWY